MEEIVLNLQSFVVDAGPLGPIVYVFAMIIAIVVSPIPSSPLAIFAGTVFGTWWAILWTMTGATLGAVIAFYIARKFGRPVVLRFIGEKKLKKVEEKFSEGNLIIAIILLRFIPLPLFDAVSYAAGITNITLRGFLISTIIGLLPLVFLFSYAGNILADNFIVAVITVAVALLLFLVFVSGVYKKTKY